MLPLNPCAAHGASRALLDPAAHGRGPRRVVQRIAGNRYARVRSGRGADIATVPCPQPCPTVAAERSSRNPNWHIPLPRQNTIMSPRRSTDLTKAAVRPPKFLPGIPSTCGIPSRSPKPRALPGGTRAQPFPRGASQTLGLHTLNLYSGMSAAL